MEYKLKLNEALKTAMKTKNERLLSTIRDLKSRIKMREIEKGEDLTEPEFLKLVATAAKQRKEAIALYEEGNRPELATSEQAELDILEAYLPQMMNEAEMQQLVQAVIAETGVSSMQEMGKVMGLLMQKAAGKADGKRLQELVREHLGA